MDLFTLSAALKLDDGAFKRGIHQAERNGKKFSDKFEKFTGKAKKLLVGAFSAVAVKKAIDGVLGFANSISSLGDQIDKQSQVLGMSRQRYQEWDYILSQTGGNIESMSTSMKTLNTAILEGSKDSKEAFKTIGLSTKDLAGKSMEDQFEAVVRAFQRLPAGAEKSAAAVKLFGKNGMELLPLLNADILEIDILRQKAKDLGLIMSDDAVNASVEYQDSLDTLKRSFQGLKNSIGSKLLPVLSNAFDKMSQYAGKLHKAYEKNGMKGVFDTIAQDIRSIKWPTWNDVKEAFTAAWDTIKNGAKSVMKLIFGETEDGGIAWPTPQEIWGKVKAGLSAMWDGVKSLASSVLKFVFGEDADGGIKFPTAKEIETKVKDSLTAMWDGVKTIAGDIMKLIFGEGESGGIEFPSSEELWKKIGEVVKTLWEDIKGYASGVLKFIFGEDADGGIDWPTAEETWKKISEVVTAWWNSITGHAKGILNLALDTLGLPDVDTIVKQINEWWADVTSKVKLWIQASFFGFDSSKGETWSEGVMNDPRFPKVDLSKYDPSYFDDEHAKGLLTVPYDGYIAKLHRGEQVLTASQARHQDEGVDSGLLANMIQMLGNKIGNMSIMVGKDEFGRTVVNNSGRRMKGYMGRMTRREAKAYGR